jgi:hypothetical protein
MMEPSKEAIEAAFCRVEELEGGIHLTADAKRLIKMGIAAYLNQEKSSDCTEPNYPICAQHRKEDKESKKNGHEEACNCQECLQYEIAELEAENERLNETVATGHKIKSYVAFALTGDENADVQMAADKVMDEYERYHDRLGNLKVQRKGEE